jgi:rhodanese-related sulfurtransferase
MKRLAAAAFAAFVVISLNVVRAEDATLHTDVDTAELSVLMHKGVKIVDIRRADEWRATGVIPGSELLTAFDARGRLNAEFPSRFASLFEKDEEVIIVCRSGNRSEVLSRALAEQAGYTRIYNASGGILSWIGDGSQTEPCPVC